MIMNDVTLDPVDQAYCEGKLGRENKKNRDAFRSCRVTRNFLLYIRGRPDRAKGLFPPVADIRYCRTKAEGQELIDKLKEAL